MKKRNGFPLAVPSQAFSHLGPLPVVIQPLEGALGITHFTPRFIALTEDLDPATAWATFFHECVHLALWDGGVKLEEASEERVCDVLGTYFAAALRGGFIKVTP